MKVCECRIYLEVHLSSVATEQVISLCSRLMNKSESLKLQINYNLTEVNAFMDTVMLERYHAAKDFNQSGFFH